MVHIPVHIKTTTTRVGGPIVRMNCPRCGSMDVPTATSEATAVERLFYLIPVSTVQWTEVQCGSCLRTFRSPVSTYVLGKMSTEAVTQAISSYGMSYVGNITKFCIVMSILFGVIGPFGLMVSTVGLVGTYGRRTRWKTAAYIGLVISIGSSILLAWSLATDVRH